MTDKTKIFLLLILLFPIIYSLAPHLAAAQLVDIWQGTSNGGCNANSPTGCDLCDAMKVISNIITFLWQIATAIAVVMIVYGAIRLALAGGSEEQIGKARGIITSAVIGLVIALLAWVIVNTVIHFLAGSFTPAWNQFSCS